MVTDTITLGTPTSNAVFSSDGVYRYLLRREFDEGEGICVFCMLNCSTADHIKSDPTVTRCMTFAKLWGYRYLWVVNMYAYRSPYPKDLARQLDPVGIENDSYIMEAAANSGRLVVAWGDQSWLLGFKTRHNDLLRKLAPYKPVHLGLTAKGYPKHPLARGKAFVPYTTIPELMKIP